MVSIKYDVYRYRYSSDDGTFFIREQRIAYNPITGIAYVPPTGTLLNSVVSLPDDQKKIKAVKFNDKERHFLVTYLREDTNKITTTKRYSPYEGSDQIKQHSRELSDIDSEICHDYYGESRDFQTGKFI